MAAKDVGPRIGADPEIFIHDVNTKQIVPICGIIGGTKRNPIKLDVQIAHMYGAEGGGRRRNVDSRGFYGVQEDNVMLEFNVPAYREIDLFTSAISKALEFINASFLSPKGYEYHWGVADHAFQPEILAKFPQALDIGCTPDFNAYAEEKRFKREPFSAAIFGNRRFCGGHIHVQYDKDNVPPHIFAQFMDCVAGLPYLAWDKQGGRRIYYGQPGLFREKDYGIEYRTLSNFWLYPNFREHSLLDLIDNIFNLAIRANSDPGSLISAYSKIHWEDVQNAIRTEDHKSAEDLVAYLRDWVGLAINGVEKRVA